MTGLCACGCGQPTPNASKTLTARGWIKGQPLRFVNGHNRRQTFEDRLARLVTKTSNGCWLWNGSLRDGYGRLSHWGRREYAHRVSYEHFVGPIPEGLELDHLCRNKRCVNPAHLEAVTYAENMRRAYRNRGRFVVYEVRPDGVPVDVQGFDEMVDAFDLHDELEQKYAGQRVFVGVTDKDDPERGWLTHDHLYEEGLACSR